MFINLRYKGPSYSTDPVAQDVTRFMARRAAPDESTPRTTASGHAGRFEDLYPSLYARPERTGLAAALRGAAAKAATILGRRRAAQHVIPAIALAVVIAAGPAFAAYPTSGYGTGSAPDSGTASSIAVTEATKAACPYGTLTQVFVGPWSDVWNGFQWVATVYINGICV
jgi:hypothetical protein